jgi:hypothetical protein
MSKLHTRVHARASRAALLAAGVAALALAGCGRGEPEPQNEQTGAMMPDTSQPVPNPPDAAVTGVVPQEGAVPVQPDPPAATPGAAGAPDVPVDTPDIEPR